LRVLSAPLLEPESRGFMEFHGVRAGTTCRAVRALIYSTVTVAAMGVSAEDVPTRIV